MGSYQGCLAWGVYRAYSFLCWSCRWWLTHYPLGDCQHCGRHTRVGEAFTCRLCFEQARMVQEPGWAPDLAVANQYGEQLFLANMRFGRPRAAAQARAQTGERTSKAGPVQGAGVAATGPVRNGSPVQGHQRRIGSCQGGILLAKAGWRAPALRVCLWVPATPSSSCCYGRTMTYCASRLLHLQAARNERKAE
jgi:hypothetical protein